MRNFLQASQGTLEVGLDWSCLQSSPKIKRKQSANLSILQKYERFFWYDNDDIFWHCSNKQLIMLWVVLLNALSAGSGVQQPSKFTCGLRISFNS